MKNYQSYYGMQDSNNIKNGLNAGTYQADIN